MYKTDLRPGESVRIGEFAVVTLLEKSGQVARISIEADKSVPIERVRQPATPASIAAQDGIAGRPAQAMPA